MKKAAAGVKVNNSSGLPAKTCVQLSVLKKLAEISIDSRQLMVLTQIKGMTGRHVRVVASCGKAKCNRFQVVQLTTVQ